MANVSGAVGTFSIASGASLSNVLTVSTAERFAIMSTAPMETAVIEGSFDGTSFASLFESTATLIVVASGRITPVTNPGLQSIRLRTAGVTAAARTWTLGQTAEKG